ncbi:MAG: PKD domain-containing protein [Pseudomonadota bacterium]
MLPMLPFPRNQPTSQPKNRVRPSRRTRVVTGFLGVVLGLLDGCSSTERFPANDGSVGGDAFRPSSDACVACNDSGVPLSDGVGGGDALLPMTWVDFLVSGCPSLESNPPSCRGAVPLSLRFVAVAPLPVDRLLWSFGDGSESSTDSSPTHEYRRPGEYTVSLTVAGAGGTAQSTKKSYVIVDPSPAGWACIDNSSCQAGQECFCSGDSSCPPSLGMGLCAPRCLGRICGGADSVCIETGLIAPGSPLPAGLCLRTCIDSRECAPWHQCRDLRVSGTKEWRSVCFPDDLLRGDGEACIGEDQVPDDSLCAANACVDFGLRGLCGTSCRSSEECPSHAACATITGRSGGLCLARCARAPCTEDPLLGCESPDPNGDFGFTVEESPDPEGYCAPRRCFGPADCAVGTCSDQGGALFCIKD